MEKALRALSFKVRVVRDANQASMKQAIQEFGDHAKGAEIAFFYYSGHGAQSGGQNYLIPLAANLKKEADLDLSAVPASSVLTQAAGLGGAQTTIVVLDACRDNPYLQTKGSVKGLAPMSTISGSMVAFSTESGKTARDDGMYALILASELRKPGAELLDAFRQTASRVSKNSANRQIPTISEFKVLEKVYFSNPAVVQTSQPAALKSYFFWVTSGKKGLDGAIGDKWNWGDVEGKPQDVWEAAGKNRYCPTAVRVDGHLLRAAPGNCCGNKQYMLVCSF